jgi:hypothetical protein
MTPCSLPPGYNRVRTGGSFPELVATPFTGGVNAICWPRSLPGDFGAVVAALGGGEGIVALDEGRLRALPVGAALNCVHDYPRDEAPGPVATDVFSFHADSAPIEADTWLCTYFGAPSEGLRNDEAQRRVELPATRAELLRQYAGADDAGFAAYLKENCYDLHYAPLPAAQPFSFGVGHLWRIAVDWPGSSVPPCIHRAPATMAGQPPRLLLIS